MKTVSRGKRTLIAVLATMAVSGLLTLGTGAPAQADPTLHIRSVLSGLCVQTAPSTPSQTGVQLVQAQCDRTHRIDAQEWMTLPTSGGKTFFFNKAAQACMDAHGSYVDYTPVDTWPCNGISNERWGYQNTTGFQQLASGGGKCLDIAGGRTEPGVPIVIYRCDGNDRAQLFTVTS